MKIMDKEVLNKKISASSDYCNMSEQMKSEVLEFYNTFRDSPKSRSAWGHHYFCKEDGNVLSFNPKEPREHRCALCGKSYSSELLDNVWVYLYRNEAALTILKSAILYKITDHTEYLDIAILLSRFYISNYPNFELHNKEGLVFDTIETMQWGCGRIMPQSLNESIFFVRIFTGLELIKDELPEELKSLIHNGFASQIFSLLAPQIKKIHNISCWMDCAIGVIGLFCHNKRMIDFAFHGEYNINRQLAEGVTLDGFWYEGSIHYNCFILEGVMHLALFAKAYNCEFSALNIVEKMLMAVYDYAFSNQELPNPNDGWPWLNLKTYSYIYAMAAKIFGYDSPEGKILAQILSSSYKRGDIPLSKPYYYENRISLEQFYLIPDFNFNVKVNPNLKSMDFSKSNYALLKNENINVFYKYGHHGPSHAHPDKMTIEVVFGNKALTRDLSNSGYGSVICNEWHRKTASHNTVVVDGMNHTSVSPGIKLSFAKDSCDAKADRVFEDVCFRRKIELTNDGFDDEFEVCSQYERNYDFIFHVEAELDMSLSSLFIIHKDAGLIYKDNGYSYFTDLFYLEPIKPENEIKLYWKLGGLRLESIFDSCNTGIFIAKSPSNPVTSFRTSILLRRKAKKSTFHQKWNLI